MEQLSAEEWYAKGNDCRKHQDLQGAINCYQHAIDLCPDSPALHARELLLDVLAFYNKDMLNP